MHVPANVHLINYFKLENLQLVNTSSDRSDDIYPFPSSSRLVPSFSLYPPYIFLSLFLLLFFFSLPLLLHLLSPQPQPSCLPSSPIYSSSPVPFSAPIYSCPLPFFLLMSLLPHHLFTLPDLLVSSLLLIKPLSIKPLRLYHLSLFSSCSFSPSLLLVPPPLNFSPSFITPLPSVDPLLLFSLPTQSPYEIPATFPSSISLLPFFPKSLSQITSPCLFPLLLLIYATPTSNPAHA